MLKSAFWRTWILILWRFLYGFQKKKQCTGSKEKEDFKRYISTRRRTSFKEYLRNLILHFIQFEWFFSSEHICLLWSYVLTKVENMQKCKDGRQATVHQGIRCEQLAHMGHNFEKKINSFQITSYFSWCSIVSSHRRFLAEK